MKSLTLRILAALSILFTAAIPSAWSQDTKLKIEARCYTLQIPDTPDMDSKAPTYVNQNWCYHQNTADKNTFIFNADSSEVRPELSLIVSEDGILTHGSLLAGKVTFHRVSAAEYNPYPVPLKEPTKARRMTPRRLDFLSAEKVYQELRNAQTPATFMRIAPLEATSARAAIIPWRGFWWAYRNQHLSRTENSPLGKYDRFLRARGLPAGSRTWENANHRYKGISWEGHCNGWAASAILRAEPRSSKTDSISGVTFSIDDQKGLLSEMDYCASTSFYGNRYRGRATDNRRDILPADFHKTVTYYIGQLRKPVIMDYMSGIAVDNHPVSGYDMNIIRRNQNTVEVTARMIFHKYDSKTGFRPGPAPTYIRTYKYTLRESASGQIIGGSWLSDNPDFIWVPLSIKDCSRNNPYLELNLMQTILNLPARQ